MTSFHLITGFLGSGKTTVLNHLLQELSQQKRIAVIQNEFAPSGVDGKELKLRNSNFQLVEINNGSVFCVCQLGTFEKTMQKLLDQHKPEMIFLEASGLADPISIVELINSPELKNRVTLGKIISLVDAQNFFKGLSGLQRFKHQIMIADHVIINKTDLEFDRLDEIHKHIGELNPYSKTHVTSYGKVDWESITEESQPSGQAAKQYQGLESEGRPEMSACVLRTHDKLDEVGLRAFLESLQTRSLRIKGYLNLQEGKVVSVHSVYDTLEIKELQNYVGPSELIAFGYDLTVGQLRQSYKAFLRQ